MPACSPGTHAYIIRSGDNLWSIAQRYNTDVNTLLYINPAINPYNLYIGQTICIPDSTTHNTSYSRFALSNHLRMLWEQHVYWTRLFIVSTVFGLPDADVVTNRLLQNPKDFAAVLQPFYGESIAAKFSELLTSHLAIAGELVKAAIANDTSAAAQHEKEWYANADQIAEFLSRANFNWSRQEWQRLLYDHLKMTKDEAVDYISGNYAASVTTFDNIEKEALEMADYMTKGIIEQFPNSFAS